MPDPRAPAVSIVIPIHNEEAILHAAVVDLRERMKRLDITFEIVLAENGSQDATVAVARNLTERYPEVSHFSVASPNYGAALRAGILRARGTYVVCDEIDLCDTDFYQRALKLLEAEHAELVIGSKLIHGARDERPLLRHVASHAYTTLLRILLGFRGTDTHGLKAFRREALTRIAQSCIIDRDVFASEFVVRAYRSNLAITEIPVRVMEKRRPSINLLDRIPHVLSNLAKLTWAIRRSR